MQSLQRLALADHGFDRNGIVRVDLNEVKSTEGGGILVLLPNGLTAPINLDLAALPGKLFGGSIAAGKSVKRVQYTHSEGAGRTQAGALCRNVGNRADFNSTRYIEQL